MTCWKYFKYIVLSIDQFICSYIVEIILDLLFKRTVGGYPTVNTVLGVRFNIKHYGFI